MSLLLASLLFLPAQLPTKAQAPFASPQAPAPKPPPHPKFRYEVAPDLIQHLESVGPKELRELHWTLKNTSDKPISFRVLDTAPGVRVAPEPFAKPWEPGEARKLTVSCDPSGYLAYQRRAVRLEPDDPSQPRYILRWDMTVRPEMSVDAPNKNFGEVAPTESPLLAYTFTREGGDPAEIRLETKLPDYLESEVSAGGAKASLQLTFRPSKLKPGMVAGLELLKVTTNAPLQPTFDLTLAWKLRQAVQAIPSRVVWDDPMIRGFKLELKSRDGKPFRILAARIEGPEEKGSPLFTHGPLPEGEAPSHTLKLQCFAGLEAKGTLILTCSGMDTPLAVPLAWLPPAGTPKEKQPWDEAAGKEPEH